METVGVSTVAGVYVARIERCHGYCTYRRVGIVAQQAKGASAHPKAGA